MNGSGDKSPGTQTVAAKFRWNTQHIPDASRNEWYTKEDINGAVITDWGLDTVYLLLSNGRRAVVAKKDVEIL